MTDAADWMRADGKPPVELHTDRPHAARVYDVVLGGKTNYPADREAAQEILQTLPNVALFARQNRAFMHRAVRHLAAEHGIRQFLDIGTGIPTSPNLHEIVQAEAPESRVLYADNDPIVLVHSRALHLSDPRGRTAYIQADLGDPQSILGHPELSATLDLSRPVALTLVAVLHWLPADRDVHAIVKHLMDGLPAGSFLALTHVTNDFENDIDEAVDHMRTRGSHMNGRSRPEVERLFAGMELLDPGLTVVQRWRPDPVEVGADDGGLGDTDIPLYAGVARKS